MEVRLVTREGPNTGPVQIWEARDLARDYVGFGRKRKTAIRDLGPAEKKIR